MGRLPGSLTLEMYSYIPRGLDRAIYQENIYQSESGVLSDSWHRDCKYRMINEGQRRIMDLRQSLQVQDKIGKTCILGPDALGVEAGESSLRFVLQQGPTKALALATRNVRNADLG